MAEKRMISKKMISSDAFLDMPLTAQALYFHLCMRADDDGFVDSPKKIIREVGAKDKDFKVLADKRYILTFESGVVLIKHWFLHNTIPKDRYTPTIYKEELAQVQLKCGKPYPDCTKNDNKAYTERKQIDTNLESQIRIDKKREDKSNPDTSSLSMFNIEKAWDDTFSLYPKKSSVVMAKNVWMDKLVPVLEENRKDVAILIANATKMYVNDYKERNPEDTKFQYIPKYCDWLKNDCDYWMKEYEKLYRSVADDD